MAETTREEFIEELKKQGYVFRENITQGALYADDFSRRFGEHYVIGVTAWRSTEERWDLDVCCRQPLYPHAAPIYIGHASGKSWDYKKFNDALIQVLRNAKEKIIPQLMASIQLPKELSDKLE